MINAELIHERLALLPISPNHERMEMTTKVWNLMFIAGNTGRVISASDNPQSRRQVMAGADVVAKNGWRAWAEHQTTGKRIFESAAESAHRQGQEEKRIIRFAEDNVPGFARR